MVTVRVWKYNVLIMSRDLPRPCDWMICDFLSSNPLATSHHLVMFGSMSFVDLLILRYWDILLFNCQVTSHDPIIKEPCHYLCGSPLSYTTTLSSLVVLFLSKADILVIFCHVTTCETVKHFSFLLYFFSLGVQCSLNRLNETNHAAHTKM